MVKFYYHQEILSNLMSVLIVKKINQVPNIPLTEKRVETPQTNQPSTVGL